MSPTYRQAQENFARNYLESSLKRTAGNVTEAARLAKRSRTDFHRLLGRARLNAEDFKSVRATERKDNPGRR
jgi:two-component system, NtrC family, response regulator GlrR